MGDAAGERAERFHFLCLPQAGFETRVILLRAPAPGNVQHEPFEELEIILG